MARPLLTPTPPAAVACSLNTFAKFVTRAGTPKETVVAAAKQQGDYRRETDYYGPLRDELKRLHRSGDDPKALDAFVRTVHDNKTVNYTALVKGYKKFLGTQRYDLLPLKARLWKPAGLDIAIRVNPELCLQEDGELPIILKLHFDKGEKLTPLRKQTVLDLMAQVYKSELKKGWDILLLDVRSGRLSPYDPKRGHLPLLTGEAASFQHIWRALDN